MTFSYRYLLLNGWLPGADTVGEVGGCDVGPIWAGTGTGVGGPGGPWGVGGPWRLCGVCGPLWGGPPGGGCWGGECTGGKALLCWGWGGIDPIMCGDMGGGPTVKNQINVVNISANFLSRQWIGQPCFCTEEFKTPLSFLKRKSFNGISNILQFYAIFIFHQV